MEIRNATISDLEQISVVHKECFPDSFSTQLGLELLSKMYLEYITESPELFLVSTDGSRITGFVMGYYYSQEDCLSKFQRNNRTKFVLKTILLILKGNKPAWKKLSSFLKKTTFRTVDETVNKYSADEKADLLSICVLKPYRGKGIANHLIKQYEQVLRSNQKKLCTLTVATENGRGIAFYEKNGYSVCRTAEGCQTYLKVL